MKKKKQKTVEENQEVWHIRVNHESQTFGNDDGDESGEAYGYRGTTSTSHSVHSFSIVDEKKYFDVITKFKPDNKSTYYILYAVYSTGDSFGRDHEKEIEYYGLYEEKDLDIAKQNLAILKGTRDNKTFKVELKDQTAYIPWAGYFEDLSYVALEQIHLESDDDEDGDIHIGKHYV